MVNLRVRQNKMLLYYFTKQRYFVHIAQDLYPVVLQWDKLHDSRGA